VSQSISVARAASPATMSTVGVAPVPGTAKLATKSKTKDNLPRGTSRKFTMQPHGYYDSAAEIVENGTGDAAVALWRSKTRCSTTSEWMEVGDASTGKALWRVEGRYGDRCVPHTDIENPDTEWYITVLRLYRGYETKPQLLLVYRSTKAEGIAASGGHKDVEVYLCNDAGEAENDPNAELDMMGDETTKYKNVKPMGDDDETFVFARLPQGEDAFTLTCNETFTKIVLSSTLPDDEATPSSGRRTLATLNRTIAEEKRLMTIDPALDVSLVTVLFAAIDQMMVSHDSIDYDVEWPTDYAYMLNGACLTDRKSVRRTQTFTGGMMPDEARTVSSRSCFPFF